MTEHRASQGQGAREHGENHRRSQQAANARRHMAAQGHNPVDAPGDRGYAGHAGTQRHNPALLQAGGHLEQGAGVGQVIAYQGDGPVVAGLFAGLAQAAAGQPARTGD